MKWVLRAFALAGCLSTACGPPVAGTRCNSKSYHCQDSTNALECRSGTWVVLPCRGPGGCTQSADAVSCDITRDNAGDNCALTEAGRGLCTPAGTGLLECRDGVLEQTKTCSSCGIQSGQVVCQP